MFARVKLAALAAAYVAASAGVCHAQQQQPWPSKPIRLLVGFPAGGPTDIVARLVADRVSTQINQRIVVDNRPGAAGNIAVELLAKANPDGHTLLYSSNAIALSPGLYTKLGYDPLKDIAPVTEIGAGQLIFLVHPSLPAKTAQEFVDYAKQRPGQLNYGSSGTGGLSHLSGALFSNLAQIDIVHVPYKGGNPAMIDVIAGQIQMLYSTILQSQPHIKSGKLRPLAVTTAKRSRAAPELPTMDEAGVKGYEVAGWYGMIAPLKTPQPIVDRLNKTVVQILHSPEVAPRLAADGSEPVGSTPQQFGQHIRTEVAKWAKLTKQMNIRMD